MPPGESLREQVQRRLANKELVLIRSRAQAERGSGSACVVCAVVISTSRIQYTVRELGSSMATHLGCYLVWRQESEAARLRGES